MPLVQLLVVQLVCIKRWSLEFYIIILTVRLYPGTDFDTVQVNYKESLTASADNCITKSN